MKNKIFFALLLVLVLSLCGCGGSKNPYVQEMSSSAFWSDAQIEVVGKDSRAFEKIPSASDFPVEIGYSVPEKFKWQKGYYEKIFVKNNEEEWQEIFEASKNAIAMAGARNYKGDTLRGIPVQNDSEQEFATVNGRNGALKQYSIKPEAKILYFKIAVFGLKGEKLLEKTITLSSPFMLKLKVFSTSGAELNGSISKKDFPVKICYDWSAMEKWQYGAYYEKIVLYPKANTAINVLFQGAPEFHDNAAGDDPRNGKKVDCVAIESPKQNSGLKKIFPKKTENNWSGFSTAYDFGLDSGEPISLAVMIHSKNLVLGETEIELNASGEAAQPVQQVEEHEKDLVLKIEFDSALVQKIESSPDNLGQSALQSVLKNLQVEIDGEKTTNFSINGNEITLKDIGIIAAEKTKKISVSSKITGFTGNGIIITISLNQEDLDKGEKIILRLHE
jgi:hypothetical protein